MHPDESVDVCGEALVSRRFPDTGTSKMSEQVIFSDFVGIHTTGKESIFTKLEEFFNAEKFQ